jgi:hypothetical protein
MRRNGQENAMTPQLDGCPEQHVHPRIGGKAGPRRMPIGWGAERNGPRLGNTGALTTALFTGVR